MRTANRLLGLVLGAALVGAGVVLAGEAVLATLGRPSMVLARAGAERGPAPPGWSDGTVALWCGGLLALGLALVVLELVPRRPSAIAIPGTDFTMERRGLEGALAGAVARAPGLPGAAGVTARVGRRRAALTVWVPSVPGPEERSLLEHEALARGRRQLEAWGLGASLDLRCRVDVAAGTPGPGERRVR